MVATLKKGNCWSSRPTLSGTGAARHHLPLSCPSRAKFRKYTSRDPWPLPRDTGDRHRAAAETTSRTRRITECTLPETAAENGTPTANVMYPLHTCPSFNACSKWRRQLRTLPRLLLHTSYDSAYKNAHAFSRGAHQLQPSDSYHPALSQ